MKTVAILLVRCLILKVWYPNGAHSGVEKSVLSYNESNTFAKMADAYSFDRGLWSASTPSSTSTQHA